MQNTKEKTTRQWYFTKQETKKRPSDINELLLDSVKHDVDNATPPHMDKAEELDADALFFLV